MNTFIIARLILILVVSTLLNGCAWPLFVKQTADVAVPPQPASPKMALCGRVIADLSVPWEQRQYRCSSGGTLPQLVTPGAPLPTQPHRVPSVISSRLQFFVPFKSGQSALNTIAMKVLHKHQRQITGAGRIEIQGQADRSGPRSVNFRLAQERASKVRRSLLRGNRSITAARIHTLNPKLNADRPGVLVSVSP